MIEHICMSKRVRNELRDGPLGPYLDQVAEWLERRHEQGTAGSILLCAGRFARFAERQNPGQQQWDDGQLMDYLLEGDVAKADAFHAHNVRDLLRAIGCFVGEGTQDSEGIHLLTDLDAYARDARGLSEPVRAIYADTARQIMAFHRMRHGNLPLRAFTGEDALDLFQEVGNRLRSVSSRTRFAGDLRQVLRYLHFRGLIEKDLASTVPLFINYRLSTVPKHLPWKDVRRLVLSVDTDVPPGKRDRAILLLIAGLGLRPGTVRALTLDQIHWREAELRIPRTKTGRGINLPLTEEVGQALSEYILGERPKTESREVFIRHTSPRGPFSSSSTITRMINARLDRLGLTGVQGAATLLRHSLATQLVNGGVPIKEVSDLFGHACIDTTAIYTKVDLTSLAKVPMPFALGVPK